MRLGVHLWFGCVVMVAGLQAAPARAADDLPVLFPLASSDARVATERLAARVDAVIRSHACGHDQEYVRLRAELEDHNYEHQGEDFIPILLAKIQWLRTQPGPCEARFVVKIPEEPKPAGTDDARLEAFMRRYFPSDRWRDPSVNCAGPETRISTSFVTEGEQRFYRLIATFRAERDCLHQQVNQAIRLMRQDRRMGTTLIPVCHLTPFEDPGGDFDMTVKEVVRILYLSGAAAGSHAILEPDTVAHMYKELLPARGEIGPATFNAISDCADTAKEQLGTPEEYADDQDLGGDLMEALEDAFEWLSSFSIKVAILSTAANVVSGPLALAGWTFLHIVGMEDPSANLVNAPYDVRIPETENHRLMIESSRFLTNKAIIRDLQRMGGHDNLDRIIAYQQEIREFLLQDLQRITIHDFDEYNARPYTRLSLGAIQNLFDFTVDGAPDDDPQLQIAARIVLDLSAAKFAAGSNRGRRIAPYRRLGKNDGANDKPPRHLYYVFSGADFEVTRAVLLTGQTQLLEDVAKGPTEAEPDAAELRTAVGIPMKLATGMVNTATSTYRLPEPIVEVATERLFPFEQVVKHGGIEVYYAHPAYTMTLGGLQRPPALNIWFGNLDVGDDSGIAMPTNLLPTMGGVEVKQAFAFHGAAVKEDRVSNMCGWRGFICGINPVFSDICEVTDKRDGSTLHFFNSAFPNKPAEGAPPVCGRDFIKLGPDRFEPARRPGPHFFVAAKTTPCREDDFCPNGQTFGVMEMVDVSVADAYSPEAFQKFKETRTAALMAWRPNRVGDGTYVTSAGDTIEFRVAENADEDEDGGGGHSQLWKVNGVLPYGGPVTDGAVITQLTPAGKVTITSPWSMARIEIDFTDVHNPTIRNRSARGGRSELYRVTSTGDVMWHKHWRAFGPEAAELPIQGPKKVNTDWSKYVSVTAAIDSPVVYAMDAAGDLFWFRHEGFREGSDRWLGPKKVGNGWTMFDKIVAGEDGVIYGRLPDGRLRWQRHLGHTDGSFSWTDAKFVAKDWQEYTDILAGESGVLYGIKPNGDLIWHRHDGHETGEDDWESVEGHRVGTGWNGLTVRSAGNGVIYVISPEGELRWYRHHGWEDGEFVWATDLTIDRGWRDIKHFFVLRPGE
jgi:hypothetical protein